ncbi:MAG: hypothetical protein Q7T05_02940 [Dehalococcoidia bacterium]|nr:hypothetical protein [Dehalococcoidia bacterium]
MPTEKSERLDQQRLIERMQMLDERLDNIDSVVTTLVERVMRQPIVIQVVCPSCGKTVEVSVTGNARLGKGTGT